MWSDEIFGSEVNYFNSIDPSTVDLLKRIDREISGLNDDFIYHFDTLHRHKFEKACGYHKHDGDLPPYLSFGIAFDFESDEKKTYAALLSNYEFDRQYQAERWLHENGYSVICDGESYLGPGVPNLYLDFTINVIITTPRYTVTSEGLSDGRFRIDVETKYPSTPRWMVTKLRPSVYNFDLDKEVFSIIGDKDNGDKVIAEMNKIFDEYSGVAYKHRQAFSNTHPFHTKYSEEELKLILMELDDDSENPTHSEMTLNYLTNKEQFEADIHRFAAESVRADGYSIAFDGEEMHGTFSSSLLLWKMNSLNIALFTPNQTITITQVEKGTILIFITSN